MEAVEYETLAALEEDFWWYRGLHSLVLQTLDAPLRKLADRREQVRVLDAGCGTGGFLKKLPAKSSARYEGIDFSPHAVGRAAKRTGYSIARASVEELPFARDRFDCIVSLDVLYHRGVRSDSGALAEFRRVLTPGGYLLLNLPAYESLRSSHDVAIHSARRYRRGPLGSLLESTGFEVERITYWNSALFPALAAVRTLRRGESEQVQASDVRPLPGPINRALRGVLTLERQILRGVDFPFGLSLLALARVPEAS